MKHYEPYPDEACDKCAECSRRVIGFWDGVSKRGAWISGQLYDCENGQCKYKREKDESRKRLCAQMHSARAVNRENGIDVGLIGKAARKAGISIWEMAKRLGIHPAEWSEILAERKPMPPGIAMRAMGEILMEREGTNRKKQADWQAVTCTGGNEK